MSSDGSEPVLLNNPDEDKPSTPTEDSNTRPPPLSRSSTFGVKKCWICIGDSTEDDPNHPPIWRTPCSCNLTAHEACLLDWVADLESPKKKDRRPGDKIQCPQCRSEIKVQRPRSFVVDVTRRVDRQLGRAIFPGLGMTIFGCLASGAWIHGFQSVLVVFGRDHAVRIFENSTLAGKFTYALIPLNLIFARTSYANFINPTGQFYLLSTQVNNGFAIDMTIWPPLPSTVFICLPVIRRTYNWLYEQAFGDLNKKWLEAIQPTQAQMDGQEGNIADLANEHAEQVVAEGDVLFEVELDLGGGGDEEDVPPNQPDNANNGAQPQNDNNGHVHQIGEIVEGIGLGSTVLGALVFPAVAAGMGELLSLALPHSWIAGRTNFMHGRPGLLREKWGRSVVGGCLFIVLKDALMLYTRWKRAQAHAHRRIVDYDKANKKYLL